MAGAEAAVTSAEISPISEPETAALMAEEVLPPSEATAVAGDPSPAVEVTPSSETAVMVEDPSPAEEVAPASEAATVAEDPMAAEEEGVAPAVTVGSSETDEIPAPAPAPDHKRKLDDLDQPGDAEEALKENQDANIPIAPSEEGSDSAVEQAPETLAPIPSADAAPAKRQRLDGETDGYAFTGEQEVHNLEAPAVGNGQHSSAENTQQVALDNLDASNTAVPQQGGVPSAGEQPPLQDPVMARKLEVPNNKVGVLIGKSGETIKILQHSSGVKIQITRDNEADPNSSTRPVELIGTLESINKAEQLIKAVIAEADAGGSPALVARGFGNAQSGTEQQEIRVPNEKVGMIIGKGGETIKSLQTRSGARIQLIPQHLPDGDVSKERTVRITGNKKQTEAAKEMIKEVMNQVPVKHSALSGGYNQRNFRPRGPSPLSQWGGQAPPTQPATGYDYQQRGMYPSQNIQYPQPYGSYTQPPPRSSNSAVWGQRAAAPVQSGGYNCYGQGGQTIDNQTNTAQSPAPVNYHYGQPQVAGYGQTASYTQTAPTQQNYGHGYNEQKYDSQVPSQQFYGQQPMNSQPGAAYTQQGGTPQADYAQQQPYSKPAYDGAPPSYGPPRTSQPGDVMYQGAVPSSYGSGGSTQQSYPYGQSAPTQPAAAYGQTYGPTSGQADGYTQPSSASGYPQQTGQVAAYAQGGQPASAYPQQGAQSGGYGQYPSLQPSYGDQPVPNNVNYGYQGGPADAGYGGNSVPSSGYGSAPVTNQAGYGSAAYGQAGSYPSGYEQSVPPQSGYGSQPGSAPVGYTKGLSPQPGYGGQYDSAQMYGHP